MACDQIEGTWTKAMLVLDGTDEVREDNNIRFHRLASGQFEAEFLSSADPRVPVTCEDQGSASVIRRLVRNHANGTTTTIYSGKAVPFAPRGTVIVRGRFVRVDTIVNRATFAVVVESVITGDWETEKPT